VAVVPAISTQKVLPTTPFGAFGTATEIVISAARDEYEPASFVVRNTTSSEQTIQVVVDDLQGSVETIDAASVDVKHVLVWYQASGAWVNWRRNPRNMDAFLVPELLVNDPEIIRVDRKSENNFLRLSRPTGPEYILVSERKLASGNVIPTIDEQPVYDSPTLSPVTIPANENRQIWLTVHVPETAEPGSYRGSIRLLDSRENEVARIPLKLEVYAFELPAPRIEYSMFYRARLAPNYPTVSHHWKSEAQLVADLESMLAHGVSNPICYQRLHAKEAVERNSPWAAEKLLERYLAIRRDLGITNRPLYYVGRPTGKSADPAHLKAIASDTEVLIVMARKFGATDVYISGVDEAGGQEVVAQRAVWGVVKRAGGKILATGHGDHFELSKGSTDLLVYHGNPLPRGREIASKQHALGNRMFIYGFPQSGPEDPLLWRSNYGILLWQAGYDGAMPFAFQSQFGSMWNDWDDKNYRTEALAYPAADKPISTLAFEGLREGIDDVRYLTALENLISQLETEAALSQEKKNALREARAFMTRVESPSAFDPERVRGKTVIHLQALAE
jgi:hypothetical protein